MENEQYNHSTHSQTDNKKTVFIVIGVVLFIAAAVGLFFLMGMFVTKPVQQSNQQQTSQQSQTPSEQTPSSNQQAAAKSPEPKTYEMVYGNSCYTPKDITINKGDTVKFTNNAGRNMWPASNVHPSHSLYPEFDAKQAITRNNSWSFKFDKAGAWGYHDHLKDSCTGTITVKDITS